MPASLAALPGALPELPMLDRGIADRETSLHAAAFGDEEAVSPEHKTRQRRASTTLIRDHFAEPSVDFKKTIRTSTRTGTKLGRRWGSVAGGAAGMAVAHRLAGVAIQAARQAGMTVPDAAIGASVYGFATAAGAITGRGMGGLAGHVAGATGGIARVAFGHAAPRIGNVAIETTNLIWAALQDLTQAPHNAAAAKEKQA